MILLCVAGYACEFKSCPAVTGWFGSVGAAHANSLVCAGVGDCDYTTGTCVYVENKLEDVSFCHSCSFVPFFCEL